MKPELLPDFKAATPDGESVRGFKVGVRSNGRKCLLPCSGHPLYTGEQALDVMRAYAARCPGVEVHAVTCSQFAGYEVLTRGEMEQLYAPEMEAA